MLISPLCSEPGRTIASGSAGVLAQNPNQPHGRGRERGEPWWGDWLTDSIIQWMHKLPNVCTEGSVIGACFFLCLVSLVFLSTWPQTWIGCKLCQWAHSKPRCHRVCWLCSCSLSERRARKQGPERQRIFPGATTHTSYLWRSGRQNPF